MYNIVNIDPRRRNHQHIQTLVNIVCTYTLFCLTWPTREESIPKRDSAQLFIEAAATTAAEGLLRGNRGPSGWRESVPQE